MPPPQLSVPPPRLSVPPPLPSRASLAHATVSADGRSLHQASRDGTATKGSVARISSSLRSRQPFQLSPPDKMTLFSSPLDMAPIARSSEQARSLAHAMSSSSLTLTARRSMCAVCGFGSAIAVEATSSPRDLACSWTVGKYPSVSKLIAQSIVSCPRGRGGKPLNVTSPNSKFWARLELSPAYMETRNSRWLSTEVTNGVGVDFLAGKVELRGMKTSMTPFKATPTDTVEQSN
mmetsp:Transcript_15832/g.52197  ORF Transcript_15832/g.52197 Transcript_15832/m.52197 type:complete len:234 (-) Transcript_15832:849-1550(-)